MARDPFEQLHEGFSLKPTRRLGELNECVLLFRYFTFPLLFLGLFLMVGRDNIVNRLAFIGAHDATGTVVESFESNFAINDEYVMETHFSYVFEGSTYSGYSFSYGHHKGEVPVLVSQYNPGLAKLKGSSYSRLMGLGFWVIQIPVVLLVWFILARIRAFWRTRRLLTRGAMQWAWTKEPPVGNNTSKEHTFYYKDDRGQEHEVKRFLTGVHKKTLIMYIPDKPEKAFFFTDLKRPYTGLGPEGDWVRPSTKEFLRKTFWFWVGLSIAFWSIARIGKIMFP